MDVKCPRNTLGNSPSAKPKNRCLAGSYLIKELMGLSRSFLGVPDKVSNNV
jgi:hypothetical protein